MGTCGVGQELWRAQVGGEPHTTQMLAARKIYLLRKKKILKETGEKNILNQNVCTGWLCTCATSSQADRLPEAIAGLEDVVRRLLPA